MNFLKRWSFTFLGVAVAALILWIEKLGPYFFIAPPNMFYVDLLVSGLLIVLGLLLDQNLQKLAREMLMLKKLKKSNEELDQSNKALRESMAQIKVLHGLLPICASCKKIRDPKGYWQQLEDYLLDHSDAVLSHAICPECAEKLYGMKPNARGTRIE